MERLQESLGFLEKKLGSVCAMIARKRWAIIAALLFTPSALQNTESGHPFEKSLGIFREKLDTERLHPIVHTDMLMRTLSTMLTVDNGEEVTASFAELERTIDDFSVEEILDYFVKNDEATGKGLIDVQSKPPAFPWSQLMNTPQNTRDRISHNEEGFYSFRDLHDRLWVFKKIGLAQEQDAFILRCDESPHQVIALNRFLLSIRLQLGLIDHLVEAATEDHEMEEQNRSEIAAYDPLHFLEEGEKISHIRITPSTYDKTVASTLVTSALLARSFREKYGKRVDTMPLCFTATPVESLRRMVTDAHEKGCAHHIIDIFAHGSYVSEVKKGFGWGANPLPAEHVVTLLRELVALFPDDTFTFNSGMACLGGCMEGEFLEACKEDTALARAVTLTTQVEEHMNNFLGDSGFPVPKKHAPDCPHFVSNPHYNRFIPAQLQGLRYGEALLRASDPIKQFGFNARWVSGGKVRY